MIIVKLEGGENGYLFKLIPETEVDKEFLRLAGKTMWLFRKDWLLDNDDKKNVH